MKLEARLQRAPTDEEMAARARDHVEEFQESLLQISNSTIVALDELWNVQDATGDQVSLLDTLPDRDAPDPEQLVDQSELRDRIADAIAALPEREKLVVALYYYENLTLREIGEVLGVTESRVSQLHTKAVLRLRSSCRSESCDATAASRKSVEQPSARRRRSALWCSAPRRGDRHAQARGSDSQRGARRPSGEWEDVPARGAAVQRRGGQPAGLRRRRKHRLGHRSRREGTPDVDLRGALLVRVAGPQGQPDRYPGESSFVADALGALRVSESAVFVVNAVMGVEVPTSRLWPRAAELDLARLLFVNMLDRERADFFRTLER